MFSTIAQKPNAMKAEALAQLAQTQKDRLKHIELRLRFLGEVRRTDLIQRFGIQSAAASRDLSLYKDLAPDNIEYDSSSKRYVLGYAFRPLFQAYPEQVLSWLAEQFGDITPPPSEPLLPCVTPTRLTRPDLDVLACITRAIHLGYPVRIQYHSISRGETCRDIVPFSLLDTGLRWHVRAFDRKTQEFRDFVLTRIQKPELLIDGTVTRDERSEQDIQWNRIVELELVPHPDQPCPEITEMDYGMQGGILHMKLRAAVAGYVLRKWNVDCSPDHSLRGFEYRLWLKDHLALYGVKNAVLAPGYESSSTTGPGIDHD